jgi:hypothetical protein
MKQLLCILIFAALCATAGAQTIKSLGYATNGHVVYNASNSSGAQLVLRFTNSSGIAVRVVDVGNIITTSNAITFYGTNSGFQFSAGASAAQLRTNLGLPLPALTNTNVTNFRSAIGLGVTDTVTFSNLWVTDNTEVRTLFFNDSTNQTRVQFEVPEQAKTVVRNLTGSTNTNEPFSGVLQYQDPEQNTTMQAVISNGIILRLEEF